MSKKILKIALVISMLLSHLLMSVESLGVNASNANLTPEIEQIVLMNDEVATWQDGNIVLFPEGDIEYLCMDPDARGWRWEIPHVPFPIIQSSITLPYRRLTASERAVWVAEYVEMGGPTDFEQEVIRLVNEVRMSHGRSPVALDRSLAMASRFHAQTMATFGVENNWSHNVGPYSASSNVAQVFGRVNGFWAGNAFAGPGNHEPGSVVEGLLNSPGHCQSLLNPIHQYIGAGVHVGSRWGRESGMSHYLMLSSEPLLSRHTVTVEHGVIYTELSETEVGEFLADEEVEIKAVVPSGYEFSHWEGPESVNFANEYDEETTFVMLANDVTVWAVLEEVHVTYTFDWGLDDVANPTGEVRYGDTPDEPEEVPLNPGFIFDGWEPEVGSMTENTTFDAVWTPIVTYTFDWGLGGVANPTGEVRYGDTPDEPEEIPLNPGYLFDGW
ncbi:MAG: InlB B-repeat-containing protein, partial [Defluviitaleaceae bacterium]|nr:InlB B-repeat-containing protein [Defluviitaleaceae bacterium]